MEPLTAVAVIVGRYGVQQLVAGLTGQQDLGGLAAELFGALAASEDRLSQQLAGIEQRLAGIEQRLDRIEDQRYESAIGTGLRCLADAAASRGQARTDELERARDHFRQASGAASSQLQRAAAERYLVLCGLALGRTDLARTAWDHLNSAVTLASLRVPTASGQADLFGMWSSFGQMTDRERRRRWPDFTDRLARYEAFNRAVIEASMLIDGLLHEAGVLGQALGESAPAPTTRNVWLAKGVLPPAYVGGRNRDDLRGVRWEVRHNTAEQVRIGAVRFTWQMFDVRPLRSALDAAAFSPERAWGQSPLPPTLQNPSHLIDVDVKLRVDLGPPLPQGLDVYVQSSAREPFKATRTVNRLGNVNIPAGQRVGVIRQTLTLPAHPDGVCEDAVEVRVGGFAFLRTPGE